MEVTNNYLYNNSTTGYNRFDTNNSCSSNWKWFDFIYQTTPYSELNVPTYVYDLPQGVSRPSAVQKIQSVSIKDKITKVELLGTQGKVVRCTFSNGDIQKAICSKEDKFHLEIGIAICISKHVFGGSSNYNRAIKQGLQVWEKQIKEKEEEIKKKLIAENHKRKRQRYLDRRKAKEEARKLKEREQTIQDMAEAFKRAMDGTNE